MITNGQYDYFHSRHPHPNVISIQHKEQCHTMIEFIGLEFHLIQPYDIATPCKKIKDRETTGNDGVQKPISIFMQGHHFLSKE
jgi:hypothetical protein